MDVDTDHLLIILPIPRPAALINRLQAKNPHLKITYLRHEVDPVEAFKKQDMDIPQGKPRKQLCSDLIFAALLPVIFTETDYVPPRNSADCDYSINHERVTRAKRSSQASLYSFQRYGHKPRSA